MRFALLAFAPLLALAACAPEEDDAFYIEDLASGMDVGNKIYGGSSPTAAEHDATGSMHTRNTRRGTIGRSPYCSGTLIGSQWFLTAGHCVTSGRGVTSASTIAVQFNNTPSSSSSSYYLVDAVYRHSSYNSSTLQNDIALLHLTSAPSITPVPPLPEISGYELTSADAGANVNFAGFGTTESGSYGTKLQVDLPFGGLGCSVGGCPSGYTSSTYTNMIFSYEQDGTSSSNSDDEGPCSGDSGGPAFMDRGGDVYVVGVTSWGDSRCRSYGVSTRVDNYEAWIEGYTGDLNGL